MSKVISFTNVLYYGRQCFLCCNVGGCLSGNYKIEKEVNDLSSSTRGSQNLAALGTDSEFVMGHQNFTDRFGASH